MSMKVAERLVLVALALAHGACGPGGFAGPTDVGFFADGTPIVSDGYVNARIATLSRGGDVSRTLEAQGRADGEFDLPHSISIGADDRIYVADRDNARVQVFSREFDHLATWAGPELGRPFAVAVAGERVFVVDGGDQDPERPAARVVILDRSGVIQGQFSGHGTSGGQLSEPHDLVIDGQGRVYVAELGTGRVQRFVPTP